MQEDQDLVINSFLETEFFFYLIPCYYGFVAFIVRYYKLLEIQPTYYVHKIPGEAFLKILEPEQERARNSETLVYKVLPASFVIKSKLSLYNSYLYLAMFVLSFISTSSMFYSANHKPQSVFYLFGFMAWYFAAVVLRRQHQRGLGQSIWIHRLFWILAGTFSVYKMFEDYFLPLNLIFNILFISSNLILAVYGIYRPQDSDILEMSVGNDDIPGFVKIFFQSLQLNQRIRGLFNIEDQVNQNMNVDTVDITKMDINEQDLINIGTAFTHSAENIKNQINLLNQLPRRNVFVDKKIRYIRTNDKYKSCYFILTQIDQDRAEAERTLQQFTQLYFSMREIFNAQNFPKHVLPKIMGISSGQSENNGQNLMMNDHANKSEIIQKWLDEVLKTPIFITAELLTFLKVSKQLSISFITYFEHSYKMFCSKHFLLLMHNKKKKQEKLTSNGEIKDLAGYYNREIITREQTDNQKLVKLITNRLDFTVLIDLESSNEVQLCFTVVCLVDKKTRFSWQLKKIEQNILLLNQRIQDDCNCSVPFFYKATSVKRKNFKEKLQAYRGYIQGLLKNSKYYCTSLFFFIRFDPVKLQINNSGAQMAFTTIDRNQDRKSRYLSEYEDKGAFIQVLRIDRVDKSEKGEDNLKFILRRKDFVLANKTTDEVKLLRMQLAEIYRGVSFIPQIDLKKCHKAEAKVRIENFLLKIQNLPKIEINRDYLLFYGNSLGER